MKKVLICLSLILVLCIGSASFAVLAEGEERTAISLSGCDTAQTIFGKMSGISVDNKNYVDGGASLSGKSVMPSLYVDVSGADVSSLPYEKAYLEFYYYMSDADHSDYYRAFVLSARSSVAGNAMDEQDQADGYVWKLSDFKGRLKSGWNYVCLRLRDASFKEGDYTKSEAYKHLSYFTVVDFASTKPEFSHLTDMEEKLQAGAYYMLTISVDEISLTDKPLEYGGTDGDIPYTYVQRMDGIENRSAVVYTAGKNGIDFTTSALIVLCIVVACATVTEALFLGFRLQGRRKK